MEGGSPALSRLNRRPPGRPRSEIDPEQRTSVLLIGGIAFTVVLALVLVAVGYYVDRIEPRGDPVLRVGDRVFTYAYLERRVLSDVAQGFFNPEDLSGSISRVIGTIQREEVIRIIARERGVSATREEMNQGLRYELGLPDASQEALASRLRFEILRVRLPLDEYLEIVEARVLEDKIRQQFADELPNDAEQVNLALIAAGSQARALQARAALDEGRPFAEVAREFSLGAGSLQDGEFGWAPRQLLDPQLAEVAFSITGRSGIIETEEDFYIIEVRGKEVRPIDDDMKAEIAERDFSRLLETTFEDTEVAYNLSERQLVRLASAVRASIGG